jgi:hypothetical protein
MRISDQLLDHLGDIYLKYPLKMTFIEFVERVIAQMEKQCSMSMAVCEGRKMRMEPVWIRASALIIRGGLKQ